MFSSDIVEGRRGNIVGLPLPHQAVVLEQVFFLRRIDVLGLEDSLGLAPERKMPQVNIVSVFRRNLS